MILGLFLIPAAALSAAELKYPVSEIPDSLKQGMYAVIRLDYSSFEIFSRSKSTHTVRRVITILNEKGKAYAYESLGYDKFRKIKSFQGAAYDAAGTTIKRLKQNEIVDRSATSGGTLFDDNRVKSADLSQVTYPYTVEYEYEIENNFLYSIPDFYLYVDDEVSIQKTSFSVTFPNELTPRFKLNGIKEGVASVGAKKTIQWQFENIKPKKFERYSPGLQKIVPNVLIAPVDFEYDGFPGKMDSWENLGKWQVQLNKDRDVLPQASAAKIKELTKDARNTEEKAKILYDYLQSRTRYVSVQLGIGGMQPMESKAVDELGYGDCKGLSNYMVAMLKEVGVKAYYTQIHGGDGPHDVPADFPGDYFNHIIVGVPNGADTLWLECTSQTNPFGYLGSFTGDRYGLMVTDTGGKLVRTITYATKNNTQKRKATVQLEATGDAKAKVQTSYGGLQFENDNLNFILNSSADDQKKWIQKTTTIPTFEIDNFSITAKKEKVPEALVNVDFTLKKLAAVSGKRLFLTPNLMNRSTFIPEKTAVRNNSIVLRLGFVDTDSIEFLVPEQLYPEFLPKPVTLTSRFGEYESSIKLENGKLTYFRRLKINKGEYPAAAYNEFTEFYKNINKADNAKLVFLSKT